MTDRKWFAAIGLFATLFGMYFFVYLGHYVSIDELYIYDSAESLIHRGDFLLNFTFHGNRNGFTTLPIQAINNHGSPWLAPNHEPLMPILVAPFVGIANLIPGVGNMSLIWFLNLFVTGLTSVSLYILGMRQGISPKIAWAGSLLFGIATIAAFYSRLLFREPLMGLLVLWVFTIAIEIEQRAVIRWSSVVLLLVLFVLAFLTKTVTLLLLPSLIIILMPLFLRWKRRSSWLVFLLVVITVGLALVFAETTFGSRYSLDPYIGRLKRTDWEFVLESLLGYQISPSRSLWLYSPILLLSFPGAWFVWKGGGKRVVLSVFISIFAFSVGYGISHAHDWVGGWGWGPRYLLPLIPPIMLLLVFPAMEQLSKSRRGLAMIGVFAVLGVVVQILSVAVPLPNYYTDVLLSGEKYVYEDFASSELHWLNMNWQPRWSQLVYHADRWLFPGLDTAWQFVDNPVIPRLIAILLAGVGFASLQQKYWETLARKTAYLAVVFALTAGAIGAAGLTLKHDPRVIEEWPDVLELAEDLNTRVDSDDLVLIDRLLYTDIFMNHQKTAATFVTLPYATVEFVTDEMASAPIEEQIGVGTLAALNWLPGQYDNVWLVVGSSPFEPHMYRPMERYMVSRYFPAEEIAIQPRSRAIRFLPFVAPSGSPELPVNAVFDDVLELVGFDLPAGTQVIASTGLPVSLVWQVRDQLDFDYNVGVLLMDDTGVVRADHNGSPQGTFGKMSTWEAGASYRDNHGIVNLQPGSYQLMVVVYNWQTGERLPLADGSELLNLGTIMVE